MKRSRAAANTGRARASLERAPLPASPRRGKAPRLRDDFRSFARAAIIGAAEQVLADEGLHAARIEEIARRARVAVGTIYNLVGDREALVREILRARHGEVVGVLAGALELHEAEPFRLQLYAALRALFRYFGEHRRFFGLVVEAERAVGGGKLAGSARSSQQMLQAIRRLYRELIRRGLAQGALRVENADLYPAILSGMLREVMLQDLAAPRRIAPEIRAEQLTRMFLEGANP